jgi:uncharacterized protein YndB with AHSA1/START domain
MQSPEGQQYSGEGCYLEVVPLKRLVWTDALQAGYRPNPESFFTGMILLEPQGGGTKYTAIAIHKDEAGKNSHEQMGFLDGWGKALDQLVAYVKKL